MKITQEKMDKYIKRLAETTQTIKNIYDQLSKATNNSEKTKELEEYLSLALSVEDSIYNEIGDDLLFKDQFLYRAKYLILRSDLKDKELIHNRILMYATQKMFLNPFPSTDFSQEERYQENVAAIKCQICVEYIKNIIINTQREKDKMTKKSIKKKLNTSLNSTLFNNKLISNLIKNKRYCESSARKRCIVFKHDKDLVNAICVEYAGSIINYDLNAILLRDDNIYNQIELRSALQLLEKSELFDIARDYQEIIDNNPAYQALPNNQIIYTIIKEVMEEKASKKSKKKR